MIVRQATARNVIIGPILDADGAAVTDGVVSDLKLSKNGAAPAALNGSATLTHRHTGFYSLALTASDLDTVGGAQVTIDDAANSCGMLNLVVVEEAVYDAFYAASAVGIPSIPANWLTSAGAHSDFKTAVATAVATALGSGAGFTTLATQTSVNNIPTNAELTVALAAADDATLAAIAALNNLSLAQILTTVATALATYKALKADTNYSAETINGELTFSINTP